MITIETEELFKELEKTQHDFWNIARETANFLNMLIKMTNSKSVLEIGTSNGYSAMWFALALKELNGTLDTIEFWDKRRQLALANFKKIGVENIITAHLGSALEILPNLCEQKEFDFVFIDANKSEYIKYFDIINPYLKKGAIIACDNILSHELKVKDFVDKIKSDENYQVEILNLPAGLLLAYKVN